MGVPAVGAAGAGFRPLPKSVARQWLQPEFELDGAAEGASEALPFSLLAGLLGGEPSRRLPSHAGQSIPASIHSFNAPMVGAGGYARARRPPPVSAGPSIPHSQRQRPGSAPAARVDARGSEKATVAARAAQARAPPPPPPRRASQAATPPFQTLDRVLQRELLYGRLGYAQGHHRAPSNRLPAQLQTALLRERKKSKLCDVTMVPATLRRWEASVERRTAARSPPRTSGGSAGIGAATSTSEGSTGIGAATAPPPPPPGIDRAWDGVDVAPYTGHESAPSDASPAPLPASEPSMAMWAESRRLSPYEMRRFLKEAQKYVLAVKKEPFAVGNGVTITKGTAR